MVAFPLLVPEDLTYNSFHGFVHVCGRDHLVRVSRSEEDGAGRIALEVSQELHRLLESEMGALQSRMRQCDDIDSFLEELKDILERVARSGLIEDPPQAAAVECIVAEIEEVGWERVVDLVESFQSIQIAVDDAAHRSHNLEVEFPRSYPEEAPRCRGALPRPFTPRWQSGFTLKSIVRQFEATLELHQDVWDVLDDFDAHTWVLEPERPTRDIVMRRIAIGKHCSMQLDLDPGHPRAVPEVRILGADSVVMPLKDLLNEGLACWDSAALPRHNLQSILKFEFPSPQSVEKADVSIECAICYTYRLDGAIPDVVCDNASCARPFHGSCLYEWLRGVPSTRQAFDTLFGACTYCGQPLSLAGVSRYR